MHDGLANHLRKWGLKVEEEAGWQSRGRPYTFAPRAVVCHHTASGAKSGNEASRFVVVHGRSDLPGPLCHVLLARDGTCRVIAGGRANHAGIGGPKIGIPQNAANAYAWGIEAENNGVGEPWPTVQLNAYYQLTAALLDYVGVHSAHMVIGHKEWTTRKIDPAGINMDHFRDRVAEALAHGPGPGGAKTVHLSRLKPGKRNQDIVLVKKALTKRGYFEGDPEYPYFGHVMKGWYAKWQRHLGYSGSDADGIPGRTSLQKLGFIVAN